ncbi:hypothetical protein K443DRAFT_172624 [Laccaria amethystina LaAM-08-1]|uniref:Uncharacterized protein n=1 Tax=Laccaria amethystina LaAM-08-1 TaxID=1095629 RepID=A0A0C9XD33_9AGAR|nr:hypothetical protein K443DRAFT_172624 [Laccaria amethystina LaAM-08-1]
MVLQDRRQIPSIARDWVLILESRRQISSLSCLSAHSSQPQHAPSNVLPPSNRVTKSFRQTRQETPLSEDTLPRLGKVSPHTLSNLCLIDDIAQMQHPQLFDLPGSLNCTFNQPVLRNGHQLHH